jgi:tetratricopeptide (TPR) repeat protein
LPARPVAAYDARSVTPIPVCIPLALALSLAGCARESPEVLKRPAAPARSGLGSVDFPISCDPAVQADFDRAVALLHHMTYVQAREGFAAILARDPGCAMAEWGVAMTLFQPLWPTRPTPADLASGWQAVEKARQLAPRSAVERGHIAAVAAFFQDPAGADYWQRIDRWEAAMKSLHERYPGDPEVSAFYALALLASARPGPSADEHSRAALALLLPLHRRMPDHPGAMHYIIHANDVPGRERDNLDVVRQYEAVAPDNPHAQHMPTHIYTRLGDWEGVVRGNRRAAEAALRYPVGEQGELVWDEFAHAIEYLVYAYLQEGRDREAAAAIERLLATPNLQPSAKTAFHLASTRARYALERRAWREAAGLIPRQPAVVDWDKFPWPEAVSWFARGYGALRAGDRDEPARALARLAELEARATGAGETVFARQIEVLRLDLDAWSKHVAGDDAQAVALLRQASEVEGATPKPPVTPAATLPAPELLGDLLLELRRPAEAADAYRLALRRFPRRFNGTLGLARALAAAGDQRGATAAYCQLLAIGARGARTATLPELAPYRTRCHRDRR